MKKSITLNLLLILSIAVNSQIVFESEGKKAPLENMILQVKQLNEFIDRFNYKNDFFGKPIDNNFIEQFPKEKYLPLLFDNEDKRTIKGSSEYSETYLKTKEQFINQVLNNNLFKIDKLSGKTYAVANCIITYKGKTNKTKILLKKHIAKNFVKWVIMDVYFESLNLEKNPGKLNSLPPNSGETNFIGLSKALNAKENYHNLLSPDFEYNQTSVFLFLASTNQIKFQYVKDLTFIFTDIDGWLIEVKEFNRDTQNSGWLISNILKNKEKGLVHLLLIN